MRIDETNYEKFYFGSACETFIQSEFYSLGYEALKPVPDIGYDLLVTNLARKKYLSEESRQYDIQVKGRVCYKNMVKFYIKTTDLLMLIDNPNGFLICVFCYPILSYNREEITEYRAYMYEIESHEAEQWADMILSQNDRISLKVLKEKNVPYVGFEKDYLWFNNAQLKRLYNNGFISTYLDNSCLCFNISEQSRRKEPVDANGNPLDTNGLYGINGSYAYEQEHIKYLVSCDVSDPHMFIGDCYI